MQAWIASGLGFCMNHVEEAFGMAFDLDGEPDEYVEFNTSALLRSAFKDRIEGLARAVQGGVMSPNEARNTEELPSCSVRRRAASAGASRAVEHGRQDSNRAERASGAAGRASRAAAAKGRRRCKT